MGESIPKRVVYQISIDQEAAMSQKQTLVVIILYLRCNWVYLGSPVSLCMSTRTLFHASCGSRKSERFRRVEWLNFRTNVSEVILELILTAPGSLRTLPCPTLEYTASLSF